ncbi:MAG: transposase [Bacteroidales bacterium]|nr:transposase [Bacteroidales bacterium]MDT8402543.1 transposase [Bacteroidales bacterium]
MQKESRFLELIRLQQDSGLTVKEFCSSEGIVPSTFYYWKKKLQGSNEKNDFIPLIVRPSSSSQGNRNSGRRDYQSDQPTGDHVLLELVYPNGTMVRIKEDLDLPYLRALIHLYD